jgi:glyoxylase-like metal-dependent hydrolase (beta-lactamase superfamily II)
MQWCGVIGVAILETYQACLNSLRGYLQLMRQLDLKLVKAVDTHPHADQITQLSALREDHCITVMGERSKADGSGDACR